MSPALLIIGVILMIALVYLTFRIRKEYRLALTTVEEKSAGILFFYHSRVHEVVRGQFAKLSVECFLHYLSLHAVVPLIGFGFFLRTDANFIVLILSVIFSAQLIQKVYPGFAPDHQSADETH